jgi:CBS domain-containing protein
MPISEICKREVIVMQPENTVMEAAKMMRQRHVGDVVVVEARGGRNVPVGIITDRDVVLEVVAPELDPETITVGDIMVPELATVKENAGVYETLQVMCAKGVRRLPVVSDADGDEAELTGIVTMDDLLMLFAEEFGALARVVGCEQRKEATTRR